MDCRHFLKLWKPLLKSTRSMKGPTRSHTDKAKPYSPGQQRLWETSIPSGCAIVNNSSTSRCEVRSHEIPVKNEDSAVRKACLQS